jgi:hypothetical protein
MQKHGLTSSNPNHKILEKYKSLTSSTTDAFFEPKMPSPLNVHDPTSRDKNVAILQSLVAKTVQEKKLLISKYDMTLMGEEAVSSGLKKLKLDIRERGAQGIGGLAESLHVDYGRFSQAPL